jgi:PAS domain S-box-containing protein
MLPDFRLRQRDYLLDVARALAEELDLEKLLQLIVRVATELLAGHAGLVVLRGEAGGWRFAAGHGVSPAIQKQLAPLLRDIPDHNDAARFELPEVNRRLQRMAQAATLGLLTGVGLPMIARREVVGVIFVFRSYRGLFSAQDRELLAGFASQAAIAVQNASLYRDVSQQKQQLATVLTASADGIFILTPAQLILGFNPACSRLTGIPAEQAIGQPHDQVIRWASRPEGQPLEQAEAQGWPLSRQATLYVEGDLLRRDGGKVSVGITYAPTYTPDGSLTGIVGNVRDITRFREADQLKDTFISIVSHELRTPVALIKGYVGTLRREDAHWDPEVVGQSLAVIEEESDHLAHLIDDLLDASRLQAGGMEMKTSDVALDKLAARLAERFQIQNPTYHFNVAFPSAFPLVLADEDRLTQVLSNLLSNAVKYSPEGSTVTIRGQIRPDEIAVCVSDEGAGIPEPDVPRVFARFYRAPEATCKTKGAGLGLFLAKAVVEAHGGKIWVDSPQDRGATICFTIPRTPVTASRQEV